MLSLCNPVPVSFQPRDITQDQPALFDRAYTLTNADVLPTFTTPASSEPYLQISGDYHLIHINSHFSDFASLLGTITCGMWLASSTCGGLV